jgi:hypothetical protein
MRRWPAEWRPSSLLVESAGTQWSLIALGKAAGSTPQRAINGNKRRPARSSLQREFAFRHEEKMTMSTKITMALVAAVIACASPALAGGNGNRDTEYTYKTAQFCIPQLDELPGTTRLYC